MHTKYTYDLVILLIILVIFLGLLTRGLHVVRWY